MKAWVQKHLDRGVKINKLVKASMLTYPPFYSVHDLAVYLGMMDRDCKQIIKSDPILRDKLLSNQIKKIKAGFSLNFPAYLIAMRIKMRVKIVAGILGIWHEWKRFKMECDPDELAKRFRLKREFVDNVLFLINLEGEN